MRVANRTAFEMVKYNLARVSDELNQANMIVSTGKRINTPSDDPIGLVQALKIRSDLAGIDQLKRNINQGHSWLGATENALGNVQDQISEAMSLAVRMATATTGADARAAGATIVQNLMDEILSLANTQIGGRFIFAGSKTDTRPFNAIGTYSGDTSPFNIKISATETVAVGSDGSAVFGNIFANLIAFRDALAGNNVSGIQAAIDSMDTDFTNISTSVSNVGSKVNRMKTKESIMQDLEIIKGDRLSKIEDADLAEAITNLKAKELAYQAALTSSARVMKLSLVDYV
ncbi:MAG: flagellar hook-associated protein FlgL [Desulfobacterales bacterium]